MQSAMSVLGSFFLEHLHRPGHHGCHVVIFVFGQPAAEEAGTARSLTGQGDAVFVGQCLVLLVQGVVGVIVHGIVGFQAGLPLRGVFAGDDGAGACVHLGAEHLEVLVLDNAGIGHAGLGVVDDGTALIVGRVEGFGLETHGAVSQPAVAVAEELVDGAGVDQSVGQCGPGLLEGLLWADGVSGLLQQGGEGCRAGPAMPETVGGAAGVGRVGVRPISIVCGADRGEEVYARQGFDALEQPVDQAVVAADGNALVGIVEVIVVEHHPHGQPLDDEGGQLGAGAAPLFLGVALDEPLVDVAADERQGLFFQVARLADTPGSHLYDGLSPLFAELGLGLSGCGDAPHLVKGVHVEGQVVEPPLVVSHGAVGVAVEGGDAVHEVPHPLIAGVEDVCAVLVHVNVLHLQTMDIAAEVRPTVDHQTPLACLAGQMGKGGTEQARANDEIVVLQRVDEERGLFIYYNKV